MASRNKKAKKVVKNTKSDPFAAYPKELFLYEDDVGTIDFVDGKVGAFVNVNYPHPESKDTVVLKYVLVEVGVVKTKTSTTYTKTIGR